MNTPPPHAGQVHSVPAAEIDPDRHLWVNKPGDRPYLFTIHVVREVENGQLRVEYGGTNALVPRTKHVLVADRDPRS